MRIAFIFLLVPSFYFSCTSSKHSASTVEAAMHEYDRLIKNMDADSIALLYTPNGELGKMAKGRDSIRNFLLSFKDLHVLSQLSLTDSLHISKDSAYQTGTYKQIVLLNSKDTVTVKGRYFANWLWLPKTGWHIQRMDTTPIN